MKNRNNIIARMEKMDLILVDQTEYQTADKVLSSLKLKSEGPESLLDDSEKKYNSVVLGNKETLKILGIIKYVVKVLIGYSRWHIRSPSCRSQDSPL
jgi:hypothetical protein